MNGPGGDPAAPALSTQMMSRALELARRGRWSVAPNPKVGAVVTDRHGAVAGEGWHRRAGEPHAEAIALERAGSAAAGGTLWVTLEPCAHHGRTAPCADAVIAAGISRVVASHRDPDPRTSGAGFERMRAAGIDVEVGPGAAAAIRLNAPFLQALLVGRPLVTLKWGASLDGRIATAGGASRWITGEAARSAGLDLRSEHDAILVGSGTVVGDDPRLDRRGRRRGAGARGGGPIVRVILDRRLRTSPSARLFSVAGPIVIYTESRSIESAGALEAGGAEVVVLDRVDPGAVLADLARREIQSVLVEGGAGIAGAFRDAGLWDRIVAFIAPRILGGSGALPPVGGAGVRRLDESEPLDEVRIRRRGGDFEISGWRGGCLAALSSSVGA